MPKQWQPQTALTQQEQQQPFNNICRCHYQLPTMTLEKFDDNKRDWPVFHEAFNTTIGRMIGSTKAEKLLVLRKMLEGKPHTLIHGLKMEGKNFDVAMQLLIDTYGAKDDYIRTLNMELSNLKRCDNLRDTQDFVLQRITREMKYVGEDIDTPSIWWQLEKKLSPSFLRTIMRKRREDPDQWNTTEFLKILNEAVERETAIAETMREFGHQPKIRQLPSAQQQQSRQPLYQSRQKASKQQDKPRVAEGDKDQ